MFKLANLSTRTCLFVQFAAAAVVPAPFNTELECATAVVDTIKAPVLVYGELVQRRIAAMKELYEQCSALPSHDAVECKRLFAKYAITVVQGLTFEIEARRIVMRNYAIARLEDYYVCRNGPEEVFTPQLLCALRTYEHSLVELRPLTDRAMERYEVLRSRFTTCLETPEDLQATCLVTLFRDATVISIAVTEELVELRPVFIEKSLELLEEYNTCRLA